MKAFVFTIAGLLAFFLGMVLLYRTQGMTTVAPPPTVVTANVSDSTPRPTPTPELPPPTPFPSGETPTNADQETKTEKLATTLRISTSDKMIDGFPKTVTVHEGDKQHTLVFTGKMTRKRSVFFVTLHLYSLASYVEGAEDMTYDQLTEALLKDDVRKVYLLRFLKPLPGKQIYKAIQDEIDYTFTDVDMDRLKPNIDQFTRPFGQGSSTGDTVYMCWLPGGRVFSGYKTPHNVQLVAQEFTLARAIWRIWAGKHVPEDRLSIVSQFAPEQHGVAPAGN